MTQNWTAKWWANTVSKKQLDAYLKETGVGFEKILHTAFMDEVTADNTKKFEHKLKLSHALIGH